MDIRITSTYNTYRQLKFNVGKKQNKTKQKTVNLFRVRRDDSERSNKRSEIDMGLDLFSPTVSLLFQ